MKALASRFEANRGLALALVAVVALLFYLPGFASLPPTDRDESRFAEASRQMIETGNVVDIRFQDEPRYKKPIGIYWLQSGAAYLAGRPADAIWPYRLPSLLGALAALGFVFCLGERLFDRRVALMAPLLLGATLLLGVEARLARTDACLLATTMVTLDALAAAYFGRANRRTAIQFWVGLGLSVLIKGPILPLIAFSTVTTLSIFERRVVWLRSLEPLLGLPILAAMVAPWLIAIGLASHGDFFLASLGNDFFAKLLSAQELHGFPPGFYFAALAVTFWPGGILVGAAMPTVWRQRRLPAFRFLLAWLLPAWLVMELIPTKLPHYVLPLYPAVAILAAAVFADRNPPVAAGWPRWLIRTGVGLWLLTGLGLPIGVGIAGWWLTGRVDPAAVVTSLAVAAAMLTALRLLARDRPWPALGAILAAGLALQAGAFGAMLPGLDQLWLSRQVESLVAAKAPCPHPVVASAGYQEPSLVFLLGRQTRLVEVAEAAQYLVDQRGKPCALALISSENEATFRADLSGAAPQALGQATGLNYSTGRRERLTLYALP